MSKGYVILPETTELAILAYIREEVGTGTEGDLIDRLVQDPTHVDLKAEEILLSVSDMGRVLWMNNSSGYAELDLPRSKGVRFGFHPISLPTLAALDPENCGRLMRAD